MSVEEFAQKGGHTFYKLFNEARVILMFVLGCGLIIYSVVDQATNVAYIVVGAVLIGLVPVDEWLQRTAPPRRRLRDGGEDG